VCLVRRRRCGDGQDSNIKANRTRNGAAGNDLGTTMKYLRGATGIGLGTTIKDRTQCMCVEP
jgi:hypothetical protein